jgi:amidase
MPARAVYGLPRRWAGFRSEMLAFMRNWDVIICPVAGVPAVPHGTSVDFRATMLLSYTVPYSLTGWPVVVVRGGASPEGLPIGVQVVARPWREDVALAVAEQLETALGGWQPPHLPGLS